MRPESHAGVLISAGLNNKPWDSPASGISSRHSGSTGVIRPGTQPHLAPDGEHSAGRSGNSRAGHGNGAAPPNWSGSNTGPMGSPRYGGSLTHSFEPPQSRSGDRARGAKQSTAPGGARNAGVRSSQTSIATRPGQPGAVPDAHQPPFLIVTEDAASFFKAADQAFHGNMSRLESRDNHSMQSSPLGSVMQHAPPAGMRGALSWGVGPNAYETDGRPGTRGGGTVYDLDGRPLTRNGGRPASRMVRPGSTSQGSGSLLGVVPEAASLPLQTTSPTGLSAAASSGRRTAPTPPTCSPMSPGLRASGNLPPKLDGWRTERGDRGQVHKSGPLSTGANMPRTPVRGVRGSGGPVPLGALQKTSLSAGAEEDLDALLDGMTDDGDDDQETTGSLAEINSYLRGLEDERKRRKAIPAASQAAARAHPEPSPPPPPVPALPPPPNPKIVRRATKIVDSIIEQAVKQAQVNALIREADEKAKADEEEYGMDLHGEGWEDIVREHVGAVGGDEFGAVMQRVAAAGSKLPDKAAYAAAAAAESESVARYAQQMVLPQDDFRHLGASGVKTSPTRGGHLGFVGPVQSPNSTGSRGHQGGRGGSLTQLTPPPPDASSTMARYAAHRL